MSIQTKEIDMAKVLGLIMMASLFIGALFLGVKTIGWKDTFCAWGITMLITIWIGTAAYLIGKHK